MLNLSNGIDIESLKRQLKDKGYKLTPQRRSVLDIIMVNEGKHLTTEEIYDLVKKDCPEIGLATVYRTLQLLEDINLVLKLNLDDGKNRYELVHDEEDHHHHHLICVSCGHVTEVEGDLLEQLEKEIERKYKFDITNHLLKFFGYCNNCKEKQ
jgi:Fur family transcriptional regulator, ferric uptake regulator